MNLIEARKLAYQGWVRSPMRTGGTWVRVDYDRGLWLTADNIARQMVLEEDLDAEDWEPKPVPAKPFETEVWVHPTITKSYLVRDDEPSCGWINEGWRRIRVREVTE